MNVLVLGGSGYLGSKIIKQLFSQNESVYCTVRENSDLTKLYDIRNNISFVGASYEDISELFSKVKIDYIINTVCNYGKNGNTDVIDANLYFPLRVLESAVNCGVKNFLTIGTALPIDLNIYSFSKNSFSEYGKFYSEKYGMNFIDLRVEMYYGADEPQDRFIPLVISKMIRGDVVNITAGTQHRDIIAVEDVVNWIMLIMKNKFSMYNSFDIGTGIGPSINDLVDYIWDKTGRKSVINKGAVPMRKNEPDCIADISEITKLVNYKPIYWKDGISKMIEEIRRNIS